VGLYLGILVISLKKRPGEKIGRRVFILSPLFPFIRARNFPTLRPGGGVEGVAIPWGYSVISLE